MTSTKRKPGRPKKVKKTVEQQIEAKQPASTVDQAIKEAKVKAVHNQIEKVEAKIVLHTSPEAEPEVDVAIEKFMEDKRERTKAEPKLFRTYGIQTPDGKSWFCIRYWLDRNTNTIVSKDVLNPRGATRGNAIALLDVFQNEMRLNNYGEYLVED